MREIIFVGALKLKTINLLKRFPPEKWLVCVRQDLSRIKILIFARRFNLNFLN